MNNIVMDFVQNFIDAESFHFIAHLQTFSIFLCGGWCFYKYNVKA